MISLTKPAVIIFRAVRTGFQALPNRFKTPRPRGYFADDYRPDKERLALESALGKVKQKPER